MRQTKVEADRQSRQWDRQSRQGKVKVYRESRPRNIRMRETYRADRETHRETDRRSRQREVDTDRQTDRAGSETYSADRADKHSGQTVAYSFIIVLHPAKFC